MINYFREAAAITTFAILLSIMAIPASADSGSFIGEEGESVSGTATVTTNSIKLSSNFRSSTGPDLYVYLGNNKPSKIIARLKRLSGAQTYAVPKGINLSNYSTVFIHCKRFNHTYGRARLR